MSGESIVTRLRRKLAEQIAAGIDTELGSSWYGGEIPLPGFRVEAGLIDLEDTFGNGHVELSFTIVVRVATRERETAVILLDRLLAWDTDDSIAVAIMNDPTLGGLVRSTRITDTNRTDIDGEGTLDLIVKLRQRERP